MVNEFLFPELHRCDIDLASIWFQQDGATAHTAQQLMNTFRTVFKHQIISRYGNISWPAHLPYLSACDFFLWSHLKSKVFQTRPADFNNLKQRISEE
jgi:hypothetical protein